MTLTALRWLACLCLAMWVGNWRQMLQAQTPEAVTLYATGFEVSEGFNVDLTLAGQQGWVSSGTGGNGLVSDFFEGFGQQAFVGFTPPESTNDILNVWRPINHTPIVTARPVIKFSVIMQIVDSTEANQSYDDFRWSVYNTNGTRLLTLDFDAAALKISYALETDSTFTLTGLGFDLLGQYELDLYLDFARNLWTALLNDVVIVNSKPITTAQSPLNLGDIDAVWAIRNPNSPGDNYMLFDEYRITAEPLDSIPPTIEPMGFITGGDFLVRTYGEQGLNYAIDASTDLLSWQTLKVFAAPAGGIFDFEDPEAKVLGGRFYRARQVP